MTAIWQRLTTRFLLWLFLEILLTVQNLDDLADYVEYLYTQRSLAMSERVEWIYSLDGSD